MGIPTEVDPDINSDDCYDGSDLPFDWPEELKEFTPSRPITKDQFIDFETDGKEPYPGYAEELADWKDRNDEFQRRVLEAQRGQAN